MQTAGSCRHVRNRVCGRASRLRLQGPSSESLPFAHLSGLTSAGGCPAHSQMCAPFCALGPRCPVSSRLPAVGPPLALPEVLVQDTGPWVPRGPRAPRLQEVPGLAVLCAGSGGLSPSPQALSWVPASGTDTDQPVRKGSFQAGPTWGLAAGSWWEGSPGWVGTAGSCRHRRSGRGPWS